jgi:hypothetical protein
MPKSIKQIPFHPDKDQLFAAVRNEINNLTSRLTFDPTPIDARTIPKDRLVHSKFVFARKTKADGSFDKYKARLVVLGDKQSPQTYSDTFAETASSKTRSYLLALAVELGLDISDLDVDAAFLYSKLLIDLYLLRPNGLTDADMPACVRLLGCLYGLKQAAFEWKSHLTKSLLSLGFDQLISDSCVFIRRFTESDFIILMVHVDDILILSTSTTRTTWFHDEIMKIYNIKFHSPSSSYLGIQMDHDKANRSLKLTQPGYVSDLLKRFSSSIDGSCPKTPMLQSDSLLQDESAPLLPANRTIYMQKVGSLNYLACCTRPDISFAISILSQHLNHPTSDNMKAINRVLNYVASTPNLGITYRATGNLGLKATIDSSYANHPDRKSQYGYTVHLGSLTNPPIYSKSRKSKTVSLSSTEAEYLAIADACKDVQWYHQLLSELGFKSPSPTQLYEDNMSTIAMLRNGNDKGRTKHIDIRHHYIRDMLANNEISIDHLSTKDMIADILTKPLPASDFLRLRPLLLGV